MVIEDEVEIKFVRFEYGLIEYEVLVLVFIFFLPASYECVMPLFAL